MISDKRTLDLEGISTEQQATWVSAFRLLLQYYKKLDDDGQLVKSKKNLPYSKSHRSRSKSMRSMTMFEPAQDDKNLIRGKGVGEGAIPCWVGGVEKTPKSTTNLLDLVTNLNERLETVEAERLRMTRLSEKWKEENRKIYMNVMRKSLEYQEVIDSLRCRVDELTEDNEWLTKKK